MSNQSDKDKLKFLEEENRLLRERLKLLQEGEDISSDYISRLNEIQKIREKTLKTEETSHDLVKKMQNSLRNYNDDLKTSQSIEEQLKKGKELVNKALEKQRDLQSKVSANGSSDQKNINDIIRNRGALIEHEAALQAELAKNKKQQDENEIARLQDKIAKNKKDTENKANILSADAKHLLMLKEQIEAKKKQNELDEEALKNAKEKEKADQLKTAAKAAWGLITNTFNKLDKVQTDFQRQTGKTVEYSRAIATTFSTGMISMADYVKTATDLTQQLGSNAEAIFSAKAIGETSQLVNAMGLAVDEANNLAILSRTARVEMDKQDDAIIASVDNFNKFNRTAFTGAQIMKDVAKTSAATTVSLGFSAERIAKANLEAKKLGISLDQVDRTAESLLNFEQSISSELEAELLTGKNINLEQARLLALNNDLEGVAKELGKNQELLNSYVNGNRIQQESIAKAMGMSREEMGKMIMNQKTQLGLSDEQVEKASGLNKEDFRRLTLQDSINKSVEKLTEVLAGPLEVVARLVNFMNKFYGIWVLLGTVGILKTIAGFAKLIEMAKVLKTLEVGKAIASGWSAAMNGPLSISTGGILGIAAGSAITGAIIASIAKAGDMSIANGKTIVSPKEGGLFQLSDNDEFMAAPGISKAFNRTKSSAGELKGEMREMISQARQSTEVLREILKTSPKEFAVNLETTKFFTAVNTTSYKTK